MAWNELTPNSRLGYAPDVTWYPTMVAAGSSGWSSSISRYKRVGNLIVAQGRLSGSSVTYGPNNWTLGGLPATPRDTGGGIIIGYTYYYNIGRASYGHILWSGGAARFCGVNATDNIFQYWNGSIFNGAAGDRMIFMRLQYEAE